MICDKPRDPCLRRDQGTGKRTPPRLGLLCTFGAMGCLALGIGWGHAGSGEQSGFEARYVTLVAPLWLALIFTWDIFTSEVIRRIAADFRVLDRAHPALAIHDHSPRGGAKPRPAGRPIPGGRQGRHIDSRADQTVRATLHSSQDVLAEKLSQLRAAQIGAFGNIRSDPPFRESQLPVTPADVTMRARWENGTAYVTKVDPSLHYLCRALRGSAGFASSIRTRTRSAALHAFASCGRQSPAPGLAPTGLLELVLPTGQNKVTTLWVEDTVKEFWLQPDNQACEFSIGEITLLSH